MLSVIDNTSKSKVLKKIQSSLDEEGGSKKLKIDCDKAIALISNNYLPFLLDFFRSNRETLLSLLATLDLQSSTQDRTLLKAIGFIQDKKDEKSEYISDHIDLSFTTDSWRKLILKIEDTGEEFFHHRYLELCVLSHVANELRSKDLYVVGADSYDDHRKELLPWETCETFLDDYCKDLTFL